MAKHDIEYLKLAQLLIQNGVTTDNRTKDPARSLFAHQMRFDVSDYSIPLLTSKHMFTRGIIVELIDFFIAGSTNTKPLTDKNIQIWNQWASEEGHLNRVYGAQWRNWENPNWKSDIVQVKIRTVNPDNDNDQTSLDFETNIGNYKQQHPYAENAFQIWKDTINLAKVYKSIIIDQSWRTFANFLRDIHNIANFNRWVEAPDDYMLSMAYYKSNCFSKDTTIFIEKKYSKSINQYSKGNKYIFTNKQTNYTFETTYPELLIDRLDRSELDQFIEEFSNRSTEDDDNFKWKIEIIPPDPGYVYRQRIVIDQLQQLIDTLKTDPNDRRLIVSAWNVGDLKAMALPPCHYLFQCYTQPLSFEQRKKLLGNQSNSDDHVTEQLLDQSNVPKYSLSLMLNQRSADFAIGVPFNIAQYTLLLFLICQVANLAPGEFIWSGGNIHVYEKHVAKLTEQLHNQIVDSPYVRFNRDVQSIDDFKFEDISIVQYHPGPKINYEISV